MLAVPRKSDGELVRWCVGDHWTIGAGGRSIGGAVAMVGGAWLVGMVNCHFRQSLDDIGALFNSFVGGCAGFSVSAFQTISLHFIVCLGKSHVDDVHVISCLAYCTTCVFVHFGVCSSLTFNFGACS